jgi:hypothetical protein
MSTFFMDKDCSPYLIESFWSAMSIQNRDWNNPFVTRNNLLSFHFSTELEVKQKVLVNGKVTRCTLLFILDVNTLSQKRT